VLWLVIGIWLQLLEATTETCVLAFQHGSSSFSSAFLFPRWTRFRQANQLVRAVTSSSNPLFHVESPLLPSEQPLSTPCTATDTLSTATARDSWNESDAEVFESASAAPQLRVPVSPKTLSSSSSPNLSATQGLSKFHLSILGQTTNRQRLVTGKYPVTVTVQENPTRKWLNLGRRRRTSGSSSWTAASTTELLVNGTTPSKSLASYDKFSWLDASERRHQQERYSMVSLELLAEISLERPAYVHILDSAGAGALAAATTRHYHYSTTTAATTSTTTTTGTAPWTLSAMKLLKQIEQDHVSSSSTTIPDADTSFIDWPLLQPTNSDRLWVTGFSLAGRRGHVVAVDCEQYALHSISARSRRTMQWPNEVSSVPWPLWTLCSSSSSSLPAAAASLPREQLKESSDGAKTRKVESLPVHSQPLLAPPRPRDQHTRQRRYQDALLVCDGFLVPTKDRGGLYIVKNPGHATEWTVPLTQHDANDRWFYHRAVWIDLTGDGRLSILTARCKVSTVLDSSSSSSSSSTASRSRREGFVTSGITKSGELVWLECPKPTSVDAATGTPLEADGTVFDPFHTRHLPWTTRVLASGPDVMFSVADLDTTDETVEVLTSEFFAKRVALHSIRRGAQPKLQFSRTIDDNCGQAFGCILADLEPRRSHPNRCVVDSGSTVECLGPRDKFSHLLVTSHECSYVPDSGMDTASNEVNGHSLVSGVNGRRPTEQVPPLQGGSLFAYQVPIGRNAWKTEPWKRTTVASGFTVNGKLNNMINPGAPGFVYTFYARKGDKRDQRPLIAVAGDCAESAFIFRPDADHDDNDAATAATDDDATCTNYKLMAEIQCQATVGSIGIGYDDFGTEEQESGFAKLYVPCFEKDKILVFGLGSGDDDTTGW
jgi:hypothetical protein